MTNKLKIPRIIQLIILFLLISISCKSSKFIEDSQQSKFIGVWYLCKDNKFGVETSRNQCPEIEFYKNNTGLYRGALKEIRFKWFLKKDTINFILDGKDSKKEFFAHTNKLLFTFSSNERRNALKLIDHKSQIWYLLLSDKNK